MKTKTYIWIGCGAVVAYIVYIKLIQSGTIGAPSGSGSISQAGTASSPGNTGGSAAGIGQAGGGSTDVIGTFDGWINQILGI